ncbi:MAG: GCN5 family acetyltransferase [Methanomicrobiales archaeon HGW-Methanomicrobiales-1]|jgi:nucleotide-binding universal stress UspA family protein|nr:MAG: GCN5 family acetyltransferase [Methanomicrobiales archaeon HGW-Methanomicrobiales-1]
MFEKVLIPTDLSETSEKLVACANDIRNIQEVVLLHIIRTGHTRDKEREAVKQQQALITNPDIAVRCLIKEDPAHDIPAVILKTAETDRPSLIIMGARKGRLSKILLGHDDIEVLAHSRTHVLIMRFPEQGILPFHPRMMEAPLFFRILFPLDFSRPANVALKYVGELEGVSEIILLHVIRKIETEERMNFILREAEKRLADTREKIKAAHPGIQVKMMVRYGDPTSQIVIVADEEAVSLVMMARFGKRDYIRKVPLGITTSKVTALTKKPVLVMFTAIQLEINTRELAPSEFYLAEKIWFDYHQTKSDPEHDRIFAVFIEDTPVSVARCKRHDDGYEVDGIFTWDEFRGNGYARNAIEALIRECGASTLYMYAVQHLVDFYTSFGFEPIPERDLPLTVRERYAWALGEMKGAEICPMKRRAG